MEENVMAAIWQDLRHAWRRFGRNPGFTMVVVLTLALGIAATSAIVSVVFGVLVADLPYPAADQVLRFQSVRSAEGQVETWPSSYHDLRDWAEQTADLLDDFAFYSYPNAFNLQTAGEADRVEGELVSSAYFHLLGVHPIAGRTFTAAEDQERGAPRAVVLGHSLWQRRYGSDPQAVGQQLIINDQAYEILGVLPAGFRGLTDQAEIFLPVMMSDELLGATRFLDLRGARWLQGAARLQPGVQLSAVQGKLDAINAELANTYPDTNTDMGVVVKTLPEELRGDLRFPLLTLLGSSGFVLLIAYTTVANLLLGRASARQRELAVRTVQGATRVQLVRQLLTESLLLTVLATGLGLLLAGWTTRLFVVASAVDFKSHVDYGLRPGVIAVVTALALLCTVGFGVTPAWLSSRIGNFVTTLREGASSLSRERTRFQAVLVAAEVALAFCLLLGAGLMLRGFLTLRQVDLGIRPDQLLSARVELKGQRYADPAVMTTLARTYREHLLSLPGVTDVGIAMPILPSDPWIGMTHIIEDKVTATSNGQVLLVFNMVTPGYFDLIGIPLRAGRDFTAGDGLNSDLVAIVDEDLARTQWPNQDPIGKRVRFGRRDPNAPWRTVVGVVGKVRHQAMQEVEWPGSDIYYPVLQFPAPNFPSLNFVIKTASGDPRTLIAPTLAELRRVLPEVPPYDALPLSERVAKFYAKDRFLVLLMSGFAGLALLLALLGIYGVISQGVAERQREIGLRLALGGQPRDILWLILRRAGILLGIGLVLGSGAAIASGRVFAGLLFGMSPLDVSTHLAVAGILLAVSLLAIWLPIRRALAVHPTLLLRNE